MTPPFFLKKQPGFTLVEILVALFIFTLVSMLMTSSLRTLMHTAARAEKTMEQMEELELAFLLLSRDIEQAIDRPQGASPAFSGSPDAFTLTHMGLVNPEGQYRRSTLQQTRYLWQENRLVRLSWPALGPVNGMTPARHILLEQVSQLTFTYLDDKGRFHEKWPFSGENSAPLPKAVRIELTLKGRDTLSQLYRIRGGSLEEKK